MATEAEIRAQIAALRKARASGLSSIRHRDRELRYKSDADMASAIRDLEDQLADQTGGGRRRRSRTTTTCKGL